MDDTDLGRFIAKAGVQADLIRLETETPTVEAAAAAVGVHPDQIGKSILFLAHGTPLLVIANGTTRIGYRELADSLGISRKRLKLANAKQVAEITGYSVGTVPPFGHKTPLPTVIESGVLEENELYAGGGAIRTLIRIESAELQRVTGAEVLSFKA